jgi:hypothetical protein
MFFFAIESIRIKQLFLSFSNCFFIDDEDADVVFEHALDHNFYPLEPKQLFLR